MTERLIANMPQLANPEVWEDPRLWAVSYLEFFVRDGEPASRDSRRHLERNARYMARAVGDFALVLMDSVWLPEMYGLEVQTSWVETDFRRSTEPDLRVALARRDRYRRLGLGRVVRSRRALRATARDVVYMLWLEYQAEAGPEAPLGRGLAPVLEMLARYRVRFSHTSGPIENA